MEEEVGEDEEGGFDMYADVDLGVPAVAFDAAPVPLHAHFMSREETVTANLLTAKIKKCTTLPELHRLGPSIPKFNQMHIFLALRALCGMVGPGRTGSGGEAHNRPEKIGDKEERFLEKVLERVREVIEDVEGESVLDIVKNVQLLGVVPKKAVSAAILIRAKQVAHLLREDAPEVISTLQAWVTGHASKAPAPAATALSPTSPTSPTAPAFDARKLLIRLAKSKSAADLCRLGIHIKDMNVGHLTDALRVAFNLFSPSVHGGIGEEELKFVSMALARAADVASSLDARHMVDVLKFAAFLLYREVPPPPEVLDPLLAQAVHLAAGFAPGEASAVLQTVADWGAGTTIHGAALVTALQALPQPMAPTAPASAASRKTAEQALSCQLAKTESAAELCRLAGRVRDMQFINLTDALRKADQLFNPSLVGEEELNFVSMVLTCAASVARSFDANRMVDFLWFAGRLSALPCPTVIDPLLEQAVHLASDFDPTEAAILLKAVVDWGAGTTTHGETLMKTLDPSAPRAAHKGVVISGPRVMEPADLLLSEEELAANGFDLEQKGPRRNSLVRAAPPLLPSPWAPEIPPGFIRFTAPKG
eukprot:CAMPEP_0180140188 /NCGR_PEP_ID=MMETSP0986-20121125/14057_1 /TAXON_ID=697907 /ORGANISM="non described non described, Strain CCMP2293" /LENGTH=592 /DNA_ID=CAMNT_0022082589 /DNA_START=33 /DNA_END=1807 /DNA_ORIENTATION=+